VDPSTLSTYCASNLDKCKPQTYVDPSTLSTYCASNLDKCKPQTYVDPKNCIINNTYKFLIEIKEGNGILDALFSDVNINTDLSYSFRENNDYFNIPIISNKCHIFFYAKTPSNSFDTPIITIEYNGDTTKDIELIDDNQIHYYQVEVNVNSSQNINFYGYSYFNTTLYYGNIYPFLIIFL